MLPLIAGPGQVCQLLLQKTAGLAHAGDHAVQGAELRAVAFFNEIQPPRERRALRSQILDRRVNTILAAVEQAVVFEDFSRQLVQSVGIAACVVDSAAKARRAACYLQHEAAGVARAPERLAGSRLTDSVVAPGVLILSRFSVTPSMASLMTFEGLLMVMPSMTSVAFCAATVCVRFMTPPVAAS